MLTQRHRLLNRNAPFRQSFDSTRIGGSLSHTRDNTTRKTFSSVFWGDCERLTRVTNAHRALGILFLALNLDKPVGVFDESGSDLFIIS